VQTGLKRVAAGDGGWDKVSWTEVGLVVVDGLDCKYCDKEEDKQLQCSGQPVADEILETAEDLPCSSDCNHDGIEPVPSKYDVCRCLSSVCGPLLGGPR
jgi:hypothetical protein